MIPHNTGLKAKYRQENYGNFKRKGQTFGHGLCKGSKTVTTKHRREIFSRLFSREKETVNSRGYIEDFLRTGFGGGQVEKVFRRIGGFVIATVAKLFTRRRS